MAKVSSVRFYGEPVRIQVGRIAVWAEDRFDPALQESAQVVRNSGISRYQDLFFVQEVFSNQYLNCSKRLVDVLLAPSFAPRVDVYATIRFQCSRIVDRLNGPP